MQFYRWRGKLEGFLSMSDWFYATNNEMTFIFIWKNKHLLLLALRTFYFSINKIFYYKKGALIMTSFNKKLQMDSHMVQKKTQIVTCNSLNHSVIFKQSSHKTTLNILRQFLFIFKSPMVSLSSNGLHYIMRTSLPHSLVLINQTLVSMKTSSLSPTLASPISLQML